MDNITNPSLFSIRGLQPFWQTTSSDTVRGGRKLNYISILNKFTYKYVLGVDYKVCPRTKVCIHLGEGDILRLTESHGFETLVLNHKWKLKIFSPLYTQRLKAYNFLAKP